MKGFLLIAAVAAAAAPARADDIDEPPATFHKGQVGISARFALGYRGIGPRNDMVYCGTADANAKYGFASVCTGGAPLVLQLEGAYGVAQHIELTFEIGIGLGKDFGSRPGVDDGPRPFSIAPGARFFFSETKHSKLFVQPMLLVDLAGYNTAVGSRGTEYGFRGIEGWWLDVHRTYGFYLFVGESAEISPWLIAEFEGGIGIQGRYP